MPEDAEQARSIGRHGTSTSARAFSTPVLASSALLEAQKGRLAGLNRSWPSSHSRRVVQRHRRGGKKTSAPPRPLARS